MKVRTIKWFYAGRNLHRSRRHLACVVGVATMIIAAFFLFILGINVRVVKTNLEYPWHYQCDGGLCKKVELTKNITAPLALSVCQLFCNEAGGIWPKPTDHVSLGNYVAKLNSDSIIFNSINLSSSVRQLLQANINRLKEYMKNLLGTRRTHGGNGLTINFKGEFNAEDVKLTLTTPENYTLKIFQRENGELSADITSNSYFGVRHGLETLSQLIVYDDLYGDLKIARDVFIRDGPAFPYRGILLDTARNFVDKATIFRTIEAMSMSKLNTFHWHITDSQSFPYVSRTWPNMSRYGAYSPTKIYTEEDIKDIVKYGLVRGVRVLPEFDAPAHVGEGWQWVGHDATVCFKSEPWNKFCVEPPCGQLNPTSEKVYEILEGIFVDMLRDFEPDFFHMGGDEVNMNCWNSSKIIRDWMAQQDWDLSESSFLKLWNHFQTKAYDKLIKANNGKHFDAVLWTSGLTNNESIKYLDPKKYIIQIWTTANDPKIGLLIENNFRVIFSNYDALYLDCGFGAWIGEGQNWCAPYKEWQKIYDNSPMQILKYQGFSSKYKHLVLGAEATLWSEQADSTSIDARLWPRSAALAERLWSNPSSSWIHAEYRLLRHRERLVQRGILADSLEPEWCLQNQGSCNT